MDHSLLQPGQIIEVKIIDVGYEAQGIARVNNFVILVPFALKEEHVKIEITHCFSHYAVARLLSILIPSPKRQPPVCPYYEKCGGCLLQHTEYFNQLEIKKNILINAFYKISHIALDEVPIEASFLTFAYRTSIKLELIQDNNKLITSFYTLDNKTQIPIQECSLFHRSDMNPIHEINKGFIAHLPKDFLNHKIELIRITSNQFAAILYAKKANAAISAIAKQFLDHSFLFSFLGIKTPNHFIKWGQDLFPITVASTSFVFSPLAFIQKNIDVAERIYLDVVQAAQFLQISRAIDLYCGIGVLTLLLLKSKIHCIGIESSHEAIRCCQKNAQLQKINPSVFIHAKAEKGLSFCHDEACSDLIIVNPPRIGLNRFVLKEIINKSPRFIFYISCKPSTLARDCHLFLHNGYCIDRVKTYDMFPQTTHLETWVILKKLLK